MHDSIDTTSLQQCWWYGWPHVSNMSSALPYICVGGMAGHMYQTCLLHYHISVLVVCSHVSKNVFCFLVMLVVLLIPCIITHVLCYRLAVLLVWLAPCVMDRIKWSEPSVCKWEPSNNREFVIFIAIIGHHIPCIILLFCYIKVAVAMSKRAKVRPRAAQCRIEATVDSTIADGISQYPSIKTPSAGTSYVVNPSTLETDLNINNLSTQRKSVRKVELREDRERKTFVTLSYVIISYFICWVPFHIVFDCSAINPALVPEPVYTATFWLTYFNSTLNPFLYAYSSKEFRVAFKRVLQCTWKRK